MKELKIGEVFLFLGTQYIVCGYEFQEGVICKIDIWPFPGDENEVQAINRALNAQVNS